MISSTADALPQIKPTELRGFHHALLTWYRAHGRHTLPWRNTSDPYHIWVSEVMLQQTQVATVLARFYHPFLEKFPTIVSLANAPRESVMKAWEGLGYYRRAGNMHEAAKIVVSRELSVFNKGPLTTNDSRLTTLLSLPGIGQNTAHAILAFAHHQPVAILEANVKRVVARIFALERPRDAQLWMGAEMLLNRAAPFDYNQAMMDLGSMICTPKAPRCQLCPAQRICKGKHAPELYPAPKVRKKVQTRQVAILVQIDGEGRIYLERRDEALLGGLWGFRQQAVTPSNDGIYLKSRKADAVMRRHDKYVGHVTHIYTHFRLEAEVYLEKLPEKKRGNSWFTREQITALPLSKLDHKVLTLLDACNTSPANGSLTGKARRQA